MKLHYCLTIFVLLNYLQTAHQQESKFLSITPLQSNQTLQLSGTYNAEYGLKLWRFGKLAYCHPGRITAWSYDKICGQYPGATDITVFYNSTGDNQGFTFYLPSDNTVYLVFRGTDPWSITNWIDDVNTLYTSYPRCEKCEVHQGFYYSYLHLKGQVIPALSNLKQKHPQSSVVVVGHSLGAAIAVHAAADIKDITNVRALYTYGLPRVGNSAFSSWYNNNVVDEYIARITHHRDPVPHLPPDTFGLFVHINQEVFFADDSYNQFKLCEGTEDKSCSNQYLLDISIPDHLKYMGEDMTLDVITCGIL